MTQLFKNINLLLMFFLLSSRIVFAQEDKQVDLAPKTIPNSFIIHGTVSDEQLKFYTKSIAAADFEQYRLRDATVELKFRNGFTLELISAKDLTIKNKIQNLNPNGYPDKVSMPANFSYPLFEVTNSGWITAEVQPAIIKKEQIK